MIPQQLFTIFASSASQCQHDFFGLLPWYYYLPDKDFGVTIQGQTFGCDINTNFTFISSGGTGGDLPLIGLAIVDDLLRIAGMVAVAFVIYGAIQFIGSQGSPDQTSKAQTTVINALIGLAIAMIAVVFVSFLGNSLQ
jgi:Type IV secretion system pilin